MLIIVKGSMNDKVVMIPLSDARGLGTLPDPVELHLGILAQALTGLTTCILPANLLLAKFIQFGLYKWRATTATFEPLNTTAHQPHSSTVASPGTENHLPGSSDASISSPALPA
ncbi:hypothetical protein GJ744_011102 [Endocarpon pusillum]|uniref:Uncharacterized protein n=1 Tax=Endocarpon pusillum TaxID=364733 RepID=A0A8H7AH21_9EURO|nr:hypothetical protein GJ744_011102 [Endocarpon pusillum]